MRLDDMSFSLGSAGSQARSGCWRLRSRVPAEDMAMMGPGPLSLMWSWGGLCAAEASRPCLPSHVNPCQARSTATHLHLHLPRPPFLSLRSSAGSCPIFCCHRVCVCVCLCMCTKERSCHPNLVNSPRIAIANAIYPRPLRWGCFLCVFFRLTCSVCYLPFFDGSNLLTS